MSTAVEAVKERLSIVDVVSSYVQLEKAGRQFKARCPFHSEKTPSFYVSPERNSFHCFGCQTSGDIFTFVEKIEGVPFVDALKLLADRAHVDLGAYKKGEAGENSLYEVLEYATEFFQAKLQTSPEALQYLLSRGITQETIRDFRIGYAPDTWHQLETYLSTKGVRLEDAEKAGLIVKKNDGGGYYDRFRGRVMFPIANPTGHIIAFSGRILPLLAEGKDVAKYVNSPETELYKKSKVLFGYDKAKRAMSEVGACIVVEGQMDLCMSHQAGSRHTVAVSGTALTFDHLRLIQRFTNTILFCLDSDKAGIAALKRSAGLAFAMQMEVKVIVLDDAKDPADLILVAPQVWSTLIQTPTSLIDFLLSDIAKDGLVDEYPKRITKDVVPLVRVMSNSIEQAVAVKKIATKLGIAEAPIWTVIKSATEKRELPRVDEKKQSITKDQTYRKQMLLGAMRSLPQEKQYIEDEMRRIHTEYEIIDNEEVPEDILVRFAHEFDKHHPDLDPSKQRKNIEELLMRYEKDCIEDVLKRLRDTMETSEQIIKYQALSLKKDQIKI